MLRSGRSPPGREPPEVPWGRRPTWELQVRLGRLTPTPGTRIQGMVYLYASDRDLRGDSSPPSGLPLWYVARVPSAFRGLPEPGERVPQDRRRLRGWARAVRPKEINLEESDLGTVLEGRYRLPEGLLLEARFSSERPGEPRRTRREVLPVRDPAPEGLQWGEPPYQLQVRLER